MGTAKISMRPLSRGLLFVLVFIPPILYAQNESSNRIIRTDEGLKLYQIISFPAVQNVSRYEIEIEQIIAGKTVLADKITTTVNSIEVSLKAGDYRYRITAYNKMNLLEGRSEWQEFRILPAMEPVAESYQPFYGLSYELKDPDGILIVYGSDFFPESEFALVSLDSNFDWSLVTLEGRKDVIFPDRVEVSENHAELHFERGKLKRGAYKIFIRNPGRLWVCFGKVRVGFNHNADFTFSFGYSPMIAAFDTENAIGWDGGNPVQRLNFFNPAGYYMRFAWLPVKTRIGNLGLEVQLYFLADEVTKKEWNKSDRHNIFDMLSYGSFNLLYQLPQKERWQHNIRLGVGSGERYHYGTDDLGYEYENGIPIYLNFGYSAQYFLWRNLYLEAGLDVQYVISTDNKMPLNHLILRPGIGIGWQAGRWAEFAEVAEGARQGEDYSVPVTQPPKSEHLLSINWHPLIILFDSDLYYDNQEYRYLQPFNPAGVSIRYAWLPQRWSNNKLGLRFELGILDHINRKRGNPVDLISVLTLGAIYQRVLSENWQINVHVGAGISNPYSGSSGGIPFVVDFGASAQLFFVKNAYVEAGLDMALLNMAKTRCVLRPGIAIGWQFNKNNETGLRLPGTGLPSFKNK